MKKDEGKTKEQLINELKEMRQRVAVLEKPEVEHEQAEKVLPLPAEDYQRLFEIFPIGVTVVDMKGVILYCNTAVYNKGGYTEGEFTGKHFSKISSVRLKDIPTYIRVFNSIVRGKTPKPFETIYQRKDGTTGWTELSISLMKIGGKRRILVMQHDVTERKQAEGELKLRAQLLDAANDGIFVHDVDGNIIYVNEKACMSLGYRRDELMNLNLYSISTRDAGYINSTLKELKEKDKAVFKSSNIRKDGSIFPVEVHGQVIQIGKETVILSIVHDITEREKVEESLRLQSEITANLSEGIQLSRGSDSTIIYVNPRFEEMFGYDEGELIGKNVSVLNVPNGRNPAKLVEQVIKSQKEKGKWHGEVHNVKKNGTFFWTEVTVSTFQHAEYGEVWVAVQDDITERRQAEEALKVSEERYKALVETTSDFIWEMDLKGAYTYCSPQIEKLWGLDPKEMLGKTPFDLLPPEDRKQAVKAFSALLESSSSFSNMETRSFDSTGRIVFLEISGVPFFDTAGRQCGYRGITRDITERKQAEDALQKSEEKFSKAFNSCPDSISIATLVDGITIEVNDSFTRLSGYTREEVIGRSVSELNIWRKLADRNRMIRLLEKQGRILDEEFEFRLKSGEVKTGLCSAAQINISGKTCIITFVTDITERKKTEDFIRTQAEVAKNMAEGIYIVGLHDVIIRWANRKFEEMLGYEPGEMIGKHASIVNAPTGLSPMERAGEIMEVIRRTREWHGDVNNIKKDGTLFWCHASVSVFTHTEYGEVLIAVHTDITERKKLEEERQKMAKLESIGILAGGIAHDFNNILTGIMGNIGLAKRHIESGSKAEERLLEAEKASYRARDLTQQLLTFASGGAPIKKVVPIKELVADSTLFALRGSSIKPQFSFADDLWPVEIDEGQINQAITNIIINADEAMPEGGILHIGVKNIVIKRRGAVPLPRGNYVEITIKDNGIGIPKDILGKIFDPYFTTKQKGSGLGLATTYSIINNHDGHVTAESTPTVGTTFHFYLPASEHPNPAEKEATVETRVIGAGRVLVMDDEESIRELLDAELTDAGYEVELTIDGAEAIEQYTKAKESGKPFDAVILDLTIPGGMGGKDVIKKLLEIAPSVKAIVSSGYAADPIMADFKEYGFSAVVTKPYSVAQIEKVLRSILKKK